MISVDEMAFVKQRLDGRRLSPSAAASLRQLELLFLVAHDEVLRMEKFEQRARVVADKWDLIKSARVISSQQHSSSEPLPAGFAVTSDDISRCTAALQILSGAPPQHPHHAASGPSTPTPKGGDPQQQQQLTPPAAITAHARRQPAPSVYVDDEFTYDGDEAEVASLNNNSGFPTPSQSPNQRRTSSPPHVDGARSGSSPQRNGGDSTAAADAETAFIDRLACCKFVSALPLAVFQLAFHSEGDYAAVALAAALDELKLFEAQLRSSQESFVNLRLCWNHELKTLGKLVAADIGKNNNNNGGMDGADSTAAAGGESDFDDLFEGGKVAEPPALPDDTTARTTNHSQAARLDQLAAAETADGASWQAPPLIPLRRNFTVSSAELFAGYAGPTLLGPVVSRTTLRAQLSTLAARQLQGDEEAGRERIEREAAFALAAAQADRAVAGETLWSDAVYAKSTADLRVLEMKEELRRLRNELAACGKDGLDRARNAAPAAATSAAAPVAEDDSHKPPATVSADETVAA